MFLTYSASRGFCNLLETDLKKRFLDSMHAGELHTSLVYGHFYGVMHFVIRTVYQ